MADSAVLKSAAKEKGFSRKLKLFFKNDWYKIFREIYLWLNIVVMLFPFYFLIISAMKSNSEFMNHPFALPSDFPGQFWENLKMVITGKVGAIQYTPGFQMLWNTMVVTTLSLVVMILCAVMSGYALARKRFKGKALYIAFILIIQIVPFFGYIIPLYLFVQTIGLSNSLIGLVPMLVAVSLPTTIILMQGFYKSFPQAVEEAALVDGCGEFKKFWHVILPMSKGAIASMAIINFMGYWNEVGISSLMLNDQMLYTISIGVLTTNSQTGVMNYAYVMALLFFSAVPNFVFFTVFQKSIMKGVSLGGVKG